MVRTRFLGEDLALYLVIHGARPARGSTAAELADIATQTGGAAWFTRRMSSLGDQFSEIVADLSTRYVLMYTPARPLGDGTWRQIAVSVGDTSDDDLQVEARQGYFAISRR